MNDVVIVGAQRTAIGRYGGTLADMPHYEMAGVLLKELVKREGIEPSSIDDVIVGSVFQTGHFPNVARQAVFRAGLPVEVPGTTVDRQWHAPTKDTTSYVRVKDSLASGAGGR